jgi:hypothetical protein
MLSALRFQLKTVDHDNDVDHDSAAPLASHPPTAVVHDHVDGVSRLWAAYTQTPHELSLPSKPHMSLIASILSLGSTVQPTKLMDLAQLGSIQARSLAQGHQTQPCQGSRDAAQPNATDTATIALLAQERKEGQPHARRPRLVERAGGAGGGAGGHVQRAASGKHAAGVCDDGAGARGGLDEGTGCGDGS